MRLRLYEQAQALVVAAGEPGLAADDKFLKLRQAREIYTEYPEIDDKLRAALTDVSAAAAADLEARSPWRKHKSSGMISMKRAAFCKRRASRQPIRSRIPSQVHRFISAWMN